MFVVYHTANPHLDKRYFRTESAARRSRTCSNRNAGSQVYEYLPETWFNLKHPVGVKTVRSLMTGNEIQIREDTPACCDPSTETYWSM
jgi:hypothetical protein